MQIDEMVVGKADHHLTQRIAWPRGLTNHHAARVRPVDLTRAESSARWRQYLHIAPSQVAWVSTHAGNHVFTQDGRRHRPGRVDGQMSDLRTQRGRPSVGLAHHDT